MKITSQFSRLKIRSFLLFWRVRILWRLTSTVSQSVKNFLMYPNMKNLRRGCCWFSSWIRLSKNLLDAEVYQKKYPRGLPFVLLRFQSLVAANLIVSLNRTWFSPPIDADALGDIFLISWEAALSSWDYCSRLTLHHIYSHAKLWRISEIGDNNRHHCSGHTWRFDLLPRSAHKTALSLSVSPA